MRATEGAKMTSAKRQNEVEQEVCAWLREYLKLGAHARLTLDTRINFDLGVDGDDGADLVRDFSARFACDMTLLNSSHHFGPEAGMSMLKPLATLLNWVMRSEQNTLRPLRVGDLVKYAAGEKRGNQSDSGHI
jgi:Protein of unknown function (DUF1493)